MTQRLNNLLLANIGEGSLIGATSTTGETYTGIVEHREGTHLRVRIDGKGFYLFDIRDPIVKEEMLVFHLVEDSAFLSKAAKSLRRIKEGMDRIGSQVTRNELLDTYQALEDLIKLYATGNQVIEGDEQSWLD